MTGPDIPKGIAAKRLIPGMLDTEFGGCLSLPHPLVFSTSTQSSGLLPPSRGEGGFPFPFPHLPGAAVSPIQPQNPRTAFPGGWQHLPHGHPELLGAHPCGTAQPAGSARGHSTRESLLSPQHSWARCHPCLGHNWGVWNIPQPPQVELPAVVQDVPTGPYWEHWAQVRVLKKSGENWIYNTQPSSLLQTPTARDQQPSSLLVCFLFFFFKVQD